MPAPPKPRGTSRLSYAEAFAVGVVLIAALVAVGWIFNLRLLHSFANFEFYPAMPMVNALGLLILGVAVLAVQRHLDQMILVSAISAGLLSVGCFMESVANVKLDLNMLLTPANEVRTSLISAINFAFASAILALSLKPSWHTGRIFATVVIASLYFPLASIIGFIGNAEAISRVEFFKDFALPEALGFTLFAIGILSATDNPLKSSWNSPASSVRWSTISLVGICLIAAIAAAHLALHPAWGVTAAISLFGATIIAATLLLSSLYSQNKSPSLAQNTSEASASYSEQQKYLLDFMENSGDGILMVDNTGTVLYANASAAQIFAWSQDELLHTNLHKLIPKRFRAEHLRNFHRFVQSAQQEMPYVKRGELVGLTQQGFEKALAISLFKRSDNNLVVATVRELSGIERELAGKIKKTQLDSVTGIANRDEFLRFCENHWGQIVRKSENSYCIQLIDLDGLKNINNKYGREFGDTILQTVAATIKNRLRSGDKLFRYSSDAFVLICSHTENAAAEILAERIRTSLKVTPTRLGDNNIYVTCSIGLTLCDKLPADLVATVDHISRVLHEHDQEHRDQVIDVPPL